MVTIYHNPRCSKSREGLALLEEKGIPYELVNYMVTPITPNTLRDILSKLQCEPIAIVRTKESLWKEEFKDKNFTNDELIDLLCEHPKLIERPIVIHNNKAVIGRPTEKILELF